MRSYSNFTVRDLLDAFSSTAPAPGGGAAAALTGALGISLLLMAAGIRSSRSTDAAGSADLTDAIDRLRSMRPTIESLVDRDAEAYTSVIAALRMPTDAAERRQAAIASAMRAATDVPLEIMRACRRALHDAPSVAAYSIRSTHGDVGVAIELLRAAVRGAGLTIDANLASLKDLDYASAVKTERQRLDAESAADAEKGLSYFRTGG
jgi:formiminotetrahydrofolate cyclodeaminase